MAEFLLRQKLEQSGNWHGRVHSAGVAALIEHPADESSVAAMQGIGIDLGPHRASQVSQRDLRQADLILVMEKHHRESILNMDPTARGKIFLLGHWDNTEIPDPYRRGDEAHREALHLIEAGLKHWLKKLGVRN